MGLLLMVQSCVTCLSMVILFTDKGVCGQQWSVTYQPRRVCAAVGGLVNMYCSYTYPSGLTINQAYWTKENSKDPLNLIHDPVYTGRTVYNCGAYGCQLHLHSLTTSDSGQYYCRITTNTAGEKWIGQPGAYLHVRDHLQAPIVSISPPGSILEGSHVTLTCNSRSHLPAKTYSWYKTGIQANLRGTGNMYTFYYIISTDSGEYYCQTSDECGHQSSAPVKLQVYYRPKDTVVVIDPPGKITEGSRVTLTCSTDANPPANHYTWYKGGRYFPLSESGKFLIFSDIRFEYQGNYSCWATNVHGSTHSQYTELQVYSPQKIPVIVMNPSGQLTEGSSVTLTCSSDANSPVESYTWFKVNESTPVGSGQQYSITNIRSVNGGQYYCETGNRLGSLVSTAVSIKVEADQNPGLSPVMTAVVVLSVIGAVCVLCLLIWMRQMKRRQKPAEQDHVTGQSRVAGEDEGWTDDDGLYSIIQPQTAEEADDDVQYASVLPNCSRQTAGAQGDDVQYASVVFKKSGSAQSSPVQPEVEPSPIYSHVQTRGV